MIFDSHFFSLPNCFPAPPTFQPLFAIIPLQTKAESSGNGIQLGLKIIFSTQKVNNWKQSWMLEKEREKRKIKHIKLIFRHCRNRLMFTRNLFLSVFFSSIKWHTPLSLPYSNLLLAYTLGQFHQHFMCSFYTLRSQNHKKGSQLKQLLALLGSAGVKAECKHVDESDSFCYWQRRKEGIFFTVLFTFIIDNRLVWVKL